MNFSQVERVLDPPLDEMVAAHLRGCWALAESDFIEAYKCVSHTLKEDISPENISRRCQELVVSGFSKLLGSQKDENWPLPTMYAVCLDLRLLALKADHQKRKGGKGKPGETLEKASEGIMSCFR